MHSDYCMLCAADLVVTHALEWPSLTVQWLPVSTQPGMAMRAVGWLCGCSSLHEQHMCNSGCQGFITVPNQALHSPHPSDQSQPVRDQLPAGCSMAGFKACGHRRLSHVLGFWGVKAATLLLFALCRTRWWWKAGTTARSELYSAHIPARTSRTT